MLNLYRYSSNSKIYFRFAYNYLLMDTINNDKYYCIVYQIFCDYLLLFLFQLIAKKKDKVEDMKEKEEEKLINRIL